MKPLLPVLAIGLMTATPAYAQLGGDLPTTLPGLEKAPPFTADVVITSRAMPKPTAYHINYMTNRVRLETGGANGQVIITRLDEGMAYISQSPTQWLKMSLSAMGGSGLEAGNFRHSIQKTGQATVDGKVCDVYQSRSMDGSTSSTNYLYHDVPIRSIVKGSTGTTTVEYRNLRMGSVSPALFELPPGAEVMSMESLLDQVKGLTDSRNQGLGGLQD